MSSSSLPEAVKCRQFDPCWNLLLNQRQQHTGTEASGGLGVFHLWRVAQRTKACPSQASCFTCPFHYLSLQCQPRAAHCIVTSSRVGTAVSTSSFLLGNKGQPLILQSTPVPQAGQTFPFSAAWWGANYPELLRA